MRVSLPPLAVAQRIEVTVEEGAESESETQFNGRKHPLELGLRLCGVYGCKKLCLKITLGCNVHC